MANDRPSYAFADTAPPSSARRHRRGGRHAANNKQDQHQQTSGDSESVAGSLTYSASSSINSGGSQAGESTDSSFADIMKVLDLDDTSELAALMAKEGVSHDLLQRRARQRAGASQNASVTDSLNYSEDGESTMLGENLAGSVMSSVVTGQPSDSYGPDGGGFGGSDSIFFAPAMPDHAAEKRKKRKEKKSSSSSSTSSRRKSSGSSSRERSNDRGGRPIATDERSSSGSAATPTSPPPRSQPPKKKTEESSDKVWYAQWWMCGFTDALSEISPKS